MGKPMFGAAGKPKIGFSGKPLLCNGGDTCCDPPTSPHSCGDASDPRCTANPNLVPAAVIVTLPSISTAATGRFNTGGGDFICDQYFATGHPDGAGAFILLGADVHLCALFGPVLGTECGQNVRPFISFRDTITGKRMWIGYSVVSGATATQLTHFAMESPGTVTYPMADCLSFDHTRVIAETVRNRTNCGTFVNVAGTLGACTLRARTI